MTTDIPCILTSQSITVHLDGKSSTVNRTDPIFPKVLQAYREKDVEQLKRCLFKQAAIVEAARATSDATVEMRGSAIYVDNEPVDGLLYTRLLEFMNEGLPFQPLVNFIRRIRKNTSFRAVNSLYEFMEVNKHPLLADGKFIAYKRVRAPRADGSMMDIHSGTIDNRPGSRPQMPRNKVNENPEETCSYGLHVANWEYAAHHFGGPGDVMVEVEVDPEHVVAIPRDYNASKMRCCEYYVRGIVTDPNPERHLVRDTSVEDKEKCDEACDEENPCEACDPTVCDDESCCPTDESFEVDDEEEEDEEEEDEEVCNHCGHVLDPWLEDCQNCLEEDEEREEEEKGAAEEEGEEAAVSAPEKNNLAILRSIPTDALKVLYSNLSSAVATSPDPKVIEKFVAVVQLLMERGVISRT